MPLTLMLCQPIRLKIRAEFFRALERAYGQYQQHISPRLGKREPDSVRPREVLAVLWEAYERDEAKRRALGKLGAKSVHNLKATLSSIYSFGVFEELVETNVCRAVPKDKLPKRGKPRRKVYTDVEAPLLMSHVRDEQPERRIFYCLQGLAGMRPGAAAGRRWSDLDWNTPVLPSLRVWSKYQDLLSQPIGLKVSAKLRGTRCYVARDANLKGRLFRLCSRSAPRCARERRL